MPDPRLVLIETSAALPGLLPPPAYQALGEVTTLVARDPDTHPSVPALAAAGFEVGTARPRAGAAAAAGTDLMAMSAGAADVKLAKGVLDGLDHGDLAYLLGPGDDGFARTLAMEAAKAGGIEVEFVFLVGAPRGLELLRMVEVMAALRHPETGCPWDLEQDHASLARYLVEETYELLEAIESGDDTHMAEELGDVLLQVLFHAQVAFDRGAFGIDEVATGLADKLVRRHPHVFGDATAETADDVRASWDQLKAEEKPERTSPFDGVPTALPALMLAEELQRKARRSGWAPLDAVAAADHVRAGLDRALAADDPDDALDHVGQVLADVVTLAHGLDVEPEAALRRAASDFRGRFDAVRSRARARDLDPDALDAATWRALYDEVVAAGF